MKTIHILTIHYASSHWVDLQLNKIKKFFSNYKIWTIYNKMYMTTHAHQFYFCELGHKSIFRTRGVDMSGIPNRSFNHWTKLNKLTNRVVNDENTREDDILIWMDCDAFPINYVNDFITEKLKSYPFFAINRKEAFGSVIPHPSFAGTTVRFWKEHELSWSGIPFAPMGPATDDTGGQIYSYLTENNIDWYKLRLTHTLTPHQYYFAIYDELIYHHGAGTRGKRYSAGAYVDMQKLFNNIQKEDFDFLGGTYE